MASYTKANDWVEYVHEAVNCASDQFVVALSNTAPGSESNNPLSDGNGVLANVTQIAYTNLSSRNITTASHAQSGGVYTLKLTNLTLTASGGSVGPFRYVYVYDDTVSGDPIVGVWDYGSSITLNDGETLDLDFDATNGVFKTTLS